MIDVRKRETLGGGHHGWLDARHHFSFASYVDPRRMGWGSLRVWNDDTIAANAGFPAHPHANMEIVTYVRQGTILHRDSLGNEGRTEAGDVQAMSAGTGIRHSEYAGDAKATLFQIWIEPREAGGAPGWGTQAFPKADRSGGFVALASGRGDAGALPIRADAAVLGARLRAGDVVDYAAAPGRGADGASRRRRWRLAWPASVAEFVLA